MKIKKYSWKAAALAIGMVCCTITAFTVSAQGTPKEININETGTQIKETKPAANQPETANTEDQQTIIDAKIIEENETGAINEQIVKLAKKYLGNPYKFGGTDLTTGVDSIGFVKAIYELAGIKLPADINELAASGTEISLTELSAGDIIIYTGLEDKLSHAAIYDGNGQVIHASNMRQGIKMSDLNYRPICMAIQILK